MSSFFENIDREGSNDNSSDNADLSVFADQLYRGYKKVGGLLVPGEIGTYKWALNSGFEMTDAKIIADACVNAKEETKLGVIKTIFSKVSTKNCCASWECWLTPKDARYSELKKIAETRNKRADLLLEAFGRGLRILHDSFIQHPLRTSSKSMMEYIRCASEFYLNCYHGVVKKDIDERFLKFENFLELVRQANSDCTNDARSAIARVANRA